MNIRMVDRMKARKKKLTKKRETQGFFETYYKYAKC